MAPPNSNALGSGLGARGKDRCLLPSADCRLSLRGQSILEYLILITALLLAILAIRGPLGSAVDHLYNSATGKVDQAANNLIAM
jgi:hypothetical protein